MIEPQKSSLATTAPVALVMTRARLTHQQNNKRNTSCADYSFAKTNARRTACADFSFAEPTHDAQHALVLASPNQQTARSKSTPLNESSSNGARLQPAHTHSQLTWQSAAPPHPPRHRAPTSSTPGLLRYRRRRRRCGPLPGTPSRLPSAAETGPGFERRRRRRGGRKRPRTPEAREPPPSGGAWTERAGSG